MTPSSEQDLAEAIASAKAPLRIVGGGTRQPLGNPVEGEPLHMTGLAGVSLYEPGALTLVAQAGTPLAEIETVLAKEGQRLPFEPMDHRGLLGTTGEPTIGGVVAANISGPRRIQAGACRDSLIGVRFVDGTGEVLKNGGRVMKNVTGYDLVKLMAGSFGTLGVISEVSFKVLPASDAIADISLETADAAQAVSAMTTALASPYDVTGAAYVGGRVHIRVEGFEESVKYRAGQLEAALSSFGAVKVVTNTTKAQEIWSTIRDVAPFHGKDGDVWRISVKPSDGPRFAEYLSGSELVYDWGGGLVWALLPTGTDARASLKSIEGHATLVRASDETRARLGAFQSSGPVLDQMQDDLRSRFDPRGILNPGLMRVVR